MTENKDTDLISLIDDDPETPRDTHVWKVLIVDDDEDVHNSTKFALGSTPILGRQVHFLHAYSAKEAIETLLREDGIAAILLDVVMESEDAGLKLVRTIRQNLDLSEIRIILRTGQPGYAPEIDAIRDYDINDYKTKSELSRSGLFTVLTSAIRSFQQIHTINIGRRGLDSIIKASSQMNLHPDVGSFAVSIISQIARLLELEPEAVVCVNDRNDLAGHVRVIGATGNFSHCINQPLNVIGDPMVARQLSRALAERQSFFGESACTLFFSGKSGTDLAAHIQTGQPLDEMHQQLLAVFCANIAINLDNVVLVDRLHDHAYNDQLLHIPNRLAFIHAVGDALIDRRAASTVALVDINHFSQINNALGHRYGDVLLKAVASRLIDSLPEQVTIARMAADTFGILGSNAIVDPEVLLQLFGTPFLIDGTEQNVSVTIGLVRLSEIDGNGSEAVKSANIALNLAKSSGPGEACYFKRSMEFETRARMRLLRDLRAAFDRERLFVVYQPQYRLSDKELIGVEALLRWRNDEGNFVSPDDFIPVAENSGLIISLGRWVLRTACHDLQRLVAGGNSKLRMAVNVSVMQFRQPGFVESIDAALEESGINPKLLELEITESVAMLDANFMFDTLAKLRQRGIAIAIDDFGTGFSSLSYLERLNVDRLKIDQSFVAQMTNAESSLRIVETIVQLAHSLKLQVVAEGVEQQSQAELLSGMGCHEAQGYLFARPMAFRQLQTFLAPPP